MEQSAAASTVVASRTVRAVNAAPTIFALSSAPGRAAIAVFRVSGPGARQCLDRIAGIAAPVPRRAVYAYLRDPQTEEILDEAIAIWFPAPGSYTGEDMAELHVHGGHAVIEAVGLALGRLDGFAPAAPGAFTRRAFLAGKLDLTRVEAIADLIDAQTEAQRRQARRQAGGALEALYEGWRADLTAALAHVEAVIDFPDEDLPDGIEDAIADRLARLAAEVESHLADGNRGERLRDGVSVAILGPPNVGKSSLLNRLAGREAAIVSPLPGTTRDVIEVPLDLGGYPAILADTAGLRAPGEEIEAEGVARARATGAQADIRLVLVDAASLDAAAPVPDDDTIVAANKIDRARLPDGARLHGVPVLPISVRTGAGLDLLIATLGAAVADKAALGVAPGPTRTRHRLALESCRDSLARARTAGEAALAAEDMRAALHALGRITGRVDVEDGLDAVARDCSSGTSPGGNVTRQTLPPGPRRAERRGGCQANVSRETLNLCTSCVACQRPSPGQCFT